MSHTNCVLPKLNKAILSATVALLTGLTANAQFLPGHLAVLRAGDGVIDLHLKQSPIFVDQFDTTGNNASPSYTVAIPTNGANLFFFNGHAATEGNLNRSSDHKLLVFAGYGGSGLLASNGTPALLDIPRGICTVDASGAIHSYFYKGGMKDAKVNPRGAVSDGSNHFWACGNAFGTLYYNPQSDTPVRFKAFPNSRDIKIINHVVYASMNVSDAGTLDKPAGIYQFMSAGAAAPIPADADVVPELVLPISEKYEKTVAFDMNPKGDVAYMADVAAGIQKYVKAGSVWKLEYNISIPQTIPAKLNNNSGCFGLVADFSGQDPVVYATTTEGYGNSVNSNRVVRIVDTGSNAKVTTIAQTMSDKIAFRGIDFTPDTTASTAASLH